MKLRDVVYQIKAVKLHIVDQLSGEAVTIDPLEPASLRTLQRFLHRTVELLEPVGNDVKITVSEKIVKGG